MLLEHETITGIEMGPVVDAKSFSARFPETHSHDDSVIFVVEKRGKNEINSLDFCRDRSGCPPAGPPGKNREVLSA